MTSLPVPRDSATSLTRIVPQGITAKLRRYLPKRLSIGLYLAVTTSLVLMGVATVLIADLVTSARRTALFSRQQSSEAVTALFAGSVWAELEFHDQDALEKDVAALKGVPAVESAVVWTETETVSSVFTASAPPMLVRRPVGVVLDHDHLYDTANIVTPDGKIAGIVTITFSLAAENNARRQGFFALVSRASILAVTTVVLLMVLARRKVIRPLMGLVRVARRIEKGDLRVEAVATGDSSEMSVLAKAFHNMSIAIADREERLQGELKVAAGLQMSILPSEPIVPGLEMSAYMEPTTEVGGDYYDIIPTKDGCWIAVGDVSGHGLGAGVIMLMLQSSIAALVRANPDSSPATVACLVNEVLYDNVRTRMKRRDHATLSILRYTANGRVRLAGAHEDILVWRAASRTIERIETPGTWVGAVRSIDAATEETSFVLATGDLMVLYTDGVTEARRAGEQLGLDRLEAVISAHEDAPAAVLKDAIVAAVHTWTAQLQDDISVVVVRQVGHAGNRETGGTVNSAPVKDNRSPAGRRHQLMSRAGGSPPVILELCFQPTIDLISSTRRFVCSFFEPFVSDPDVVSRIGLATHELLENILKYAADGRTVTRVNLEQERTGERALTIETTSIITPERRAGLEEIFAEMASAKSALSYYQLTMGRARTRKHGSGLGLARIWAEAEMTLSIEFIGDSVTIRAAANLEDGEQS